MQFGIGQGTVVSELGQNAEQHMFERRPAGILFVKFELYRGVQNRPGCIRRSGFEGHGPFKGNWQDQDVSLARWRVGHFEKL